MALNRDWSATFNLAGVVAASGDTKNDIIAPEGFYTGVHEDNYIDTDKNPNRIAFRIEINEGPYKGSTCWGSIMKIGSTEYDNSKHWRALYESMGFQAAHLDNGAFEYGGPNFKGRVTCFYWKPGDRDNGVWSDLKFLSPMQWKAKKQAFEAPVGSAVSGQAIQAPVHTPPVHTIPVAPSAPVSQAAPSLLSNGAPSAPSAGFAPQNMSGDDLMAMLSGSPPE